ncbi:Uncharacterized protein APZ42_008849, partial [Daphnia magna]
KTDGPVRLCRVCPWYRSSFSRDKATITKIRRGIIAVAIMTVYIGSKRKLAIRWKAKNPNHTSSWNLIQYVSTNKSKDTVISVGKALLISDDKDCLYAMRIHMIKNLMASADRRVAGRLKAQCQLQF